MQDENIYNSIRNMNILLTGATGYIGKRLLPLLVEHGHHVTCCVRDANRFNPPVSLIEHITVIEVDLLDANSLCKIPSEIDAAYYLVHSMSASKDYARLETQSAINFRNALHQTKVKQVIYLSGIVNDANLSEHLSSRQNVEIELEKGKYSVTTFRAGIIIGSGSASFEIIRDIVEKLPVMITPKWLNTKCQPIAIGDVLRFLVKGLLNESVYNQSFDIGGPDVLTYREMLLRFGEVRALPRRIFVVPVMTPRLSSYWLYFVTSTSYKLAVALVHSMKVEVICKDNRINKILGVEPINYRSALERAFTKIESNEIISSWKDSQISGRLSFSISDFINVPSFGCFKDQRKRKLNNRKKSIDKIWRIGGTNGWYSAYWLWQLRGFIDKLSGGVGLRRGRTDENSSSRRCGRFLASTLRQQRGGKAIAICRDETPW